MFSEETLESTYEREEIRCFSLTTCDGDLTFWYVHFHISMVCPRFFPSVSISLFPSAPLDSLYPSVFLSFSKLNASKLFTLQTGSSPPPP